MNDSGLIKQGERNLADATFVRRYSIPLALEHKRWNIVVYEAQRVTELLLKGIICLTGCQPLHTHQIHELVEQLSQILPTLPEDSLVFVACTPSGEGYGVRIFKDRITIFRRDDDKDCETTLGASISAGPLLSADRLLNFELQVVNETLILSCEGNHIATRTDRTYQGKPDIQRGFTRQPSREKVTRLNNIGERLKINRETAFYGEVEFSEDHAKESIGLMEEAFLVASCFFVEEPWLSKTKTG